MLCVSFMPCPVQSISVLHCFALASALASRCAMCGMTYRTVNFQCATIVTFSPPIMPFVQVAHVPPEQPTLL